MARFQGALDNERLGRRPGARRTNRQLVCEHLEHRVVLAAGLTAATTTPVTATAGTLVTGAPLVSFTDGASPLPANQYAATIDWGDGTPLSGGTISLSGTSFTVTGSHNFAEQSIARPGGVYTISVVIVGDGEQLTLTTSATVVRPTANGLVGLNAVAGKPTGDLPVVYFTGEPTPDPADYTAAVDWGDGSPPAVATLFVPAPSGPLAYDIDTSGHTYAQGGSYTITTIITDAQGIVVDSVQAGISVTVIPLSGRLSPQSDTGVSQSDGITADSTPSFVGVTTPGTIVEVFATPSSSSVQPGSEIASGASDPSGNWSATVHTALADGSYVITAEVFNNDDMMLNSASLGTIVVDTDAPVITAATFNRLTDTLMVTYQDNLSGLADASIASAMSYERSAGPTSSKISPKMLRPTSVAITEASLPTAPVIVRVVFNKGRKVPAGRYLITIASGSGGTGIHDVAGNALDGHFSGQFPSGDGVPGSDFAAVIVGSGNRIVAQTSVPDILLNARPRRPSPGTHR